MTSRLNSSRIKWQSTSICLVCSWKIGFSVIMIAQVLSACNEVGENCVNPSFERSPRSHKISEQAEDIALYSAFVEDRETRSCFLHFQEMRELPRYMHQLVVDRRVS